MANFKLAIIGDIHSNVLALEAAFASISDFETSSSRIDLVVFVGDLLTYGVRPRETLFEVHRIVSSRPSAFVLGNHGQMYLDLLAKSSSDYYGSLPDWIRESVDFNLNLIDPGLFLDIKFCPQFVCHDLIVAHANFRPSAPGFVDWSYINTVEDHLEQLLALSSLGTHLGVLGHTHRGRCFSLVPSGIPKRPWHCVKRGVQLDSPIDLSGYPFSLLNAGSIGQPRETVHSNPAWLLIEFDHFFANTATFVSFTYDIQAHLFDISSSTLSSSCIQKLSSYFR